MGEEKFRDLDQFHTMRGGRESAQTAYGAYRPVRVIVKHLRATGDVYALDGENGRVTLLGTIPRDVTEEELRQRLGDWGREPERRQEWFIQRIERLNALRGGPAPEGENPRPTRCGPPCRELSGTWKRNSPGTRVVLKTADVSMERAEDPREAAR